MYVTVKARELQPGDVLYGERADHREQWNAAVIQSRAFMAMMQTTLYDGVNYTAVRDKLAHDSHRIEHVSYGPWRARIVLRGGVVVTVRRNLPVAVYRGERSYL